MTVDVSKGPIRVDVAAGPAGSTILVGEGVADRIGALLDEHRLGRRRFVVSSPIVWRFHGAQISRALGVDPILIPDGERYKTLSTVARLYDALVRAGADRGSVLVAVGGGVVGDTAGFAAATFLRGIPLVHMPTTLLAQVDSAIGGKVGVNHPLGKNLIGAFHQPRLVAIDPLLLRTLPRREFRSGLYEVVKYGMIASRELFDLVARSTRELFARDPSVLAPAIVESCRIKARVVSRDERESGLRRILNYGHTVGHALEAVTRYRRFRHGEAIAIGMACEARVAMHMGLADSGLVEQQERLLARLGLPTAVRGVRTNAVLAAMRTDKKRRAGHVRMILPTQIGRAQIVDEVDPPALRAALSEVLK